MPTAEAGVGRWLAQIAAEAIVVRRNAAGDKITWYAFPDSGTTADGLEATSGGSDATAALAAGQAALERATQSGFDAQVTVYPFGAVATEMRFRDEHEFFAPRRTDWLHIAGGNGDDPLIRRFVAVDAPDGTRIFTAGHGVCYDCASAHDGPTPNTALPASMPGQTRLTVDLSSETDDKPPLHLVIDCATTSALCDAVIRDRYALLQPLVSDTTCAGGPAVSSVTIEGTLGGVAIDTGYGNCTGGAAERWIDTLRAAGKLTGAWATAG